MYSELYAAWQREIDDSTLGALQPDFYLRIGEYMQRIKEEDKVIDKKSVKMNLLTHETQNVERMLKELFEVRYRKIIKILSKSQKIPVELLTFEEAKMCETFADFTKSYQKFTRGLLQGQVSEPIKVIVKGEANQAEATPTHKRSTIRFLRSIPAIMGADMKSYGPFVAEDVASLPPQNAQILVKQGLAVLVEVS
jgi:DNA replication factor GINS